MKLILTSFLVLFTLNSFSLSDIDSLISVSKSNTATIEDKTKALNSLAGYYNRSSLDSSLMYAEKAFQLSSKHKFNIGMCKAIVNKAFAFSNFQDRDSSITCFLEAVNYAEIAKDSSLIALVKLNLGIEYSTVGDYQNAIKWLELTKDIARQSSQPDWELKALNSIGNVYTLTSDYSKAQVAFLEALEINKQLKNDFYEAVITNNIGNIYFYLSNYEKAIEYYYLSLNIAEKIEDDSSIQSAYINIGLIYKELEKFDEAIRIINVSIEYFNNKNDNKNASNGYNSLGLVYKDKKMLDSALFYLNKALDLKKKINDSTGMSMIYNNLGSIYSIQNDFLLADKNLKIALQLSKKYSDDYNQTITYFLLGELYLKRDKSKGLEYFDKAIDMGFEYGINDVCIQSFEQLYKFYKNEQQFDKALEYYEKFTLLSDSIHSVESQLKIEDIETKYEVDKKDQEIEILYKEQQIKDIIHKAEQEKTQSQFTMLLLAICLISLLAFIIIVWVRNNQRRKIDQLEKRSLKVETQMLRFQMNPHFIFNSLNSIQSFISEKDTIDAERYLSKFAKLMRLILENSRQSYISLEDEIHTLSLYLELEQLRFDKRFDFKININNIDDEFTLVPPMLAQPYVENAILHGLASKTGGFITIDYKQSGKKIICTIDDNGIGRQKSESMKKDQQVKKSSLGIKVTQERIDLLSEERKLELGIDIIDKYNNEEATGTKVILEMPFTE